MSILVERVRGKPSACRIIHEIFYLGKWERSKVNSKSALLEENYNEMVVIKDIEIYSHCEHHLPPYFGKAHMAYFTNDKIVGLSKIQD